MSIDSSRRRAPSSSGAAADAAARRSAVNVGSVMLIAELSRLSHFNWCQCDSGVWWVSRVIWMAQLRRRFRKTRALDCMPPLNVRACSHVSAAVIVTRLELFQPVVDRVNCCFAPRANQHITVTVTVNVTVQLCCNPESTSDGLPITNSVLTDVYDCYLTTAQ